MQRHTDTIQNNTIQNNTDSNTNKYMTILRSADNTIPDPESQIQNPDSEPQIPESQIRNPKNDDHLHDILLFIIQGTIQHTTILRSADDTIQYRKQHNTVSDTIQDRTILYNTKTTFHRQSSSGFRRQYFIMHYNTIC